MKTGGLGAGEHEAGGGGGCSVSYYLTQSRSLELHEWLGGSKSPAVSGAAHPLDLLLSSAVRLKEYSVHACWPRPPRRATR